MAWTSPRTWVAGETVTAAIMNTHLRDNLLDLNGTAGTWTSYTPTVTNVTTSGLVFRYKQISKSVLVHGQMTLSAAPTGVVGITLPVVSASVLSSAVDVVGQVIGLRQGVGYSGGWVVKSTTSIVQVQQGNGSATLWSGGVPVAWANTDVWIYNLMYEAA